MISVIFILRGELKRLINEAGAENLTKDGSEKKEPQPHDNTWATNVNFVNKSISDNNTTINNIIDDKVKKAAGDTA